MDLPITKVLEIYKQRVAALTEENVLLQAQLEAKLEREGANDDGRAEA